MQNQYTGDFGDFVKYGLLRPLSEDRQLGMAWYLRPAVWERSIAIWMVSGRSLS